jgi:hypothetical protein
MSRDRELKKANVERVWALVDRAIRPEERRKTAGVVGALLMEGNPSGSYLNKAITPDRDMLLITPWRLVIVRPKPVAALGLRDAIKLRRGDTSSVVDPEVSIDRRHVKEVTCSNEAPEGFAVMELGGASLLFAKVTVDEGAGPRTIDFWIDTDAETPDRVANFQESVEVWFGRKPVTA